MRFILLPFENYENNIMYIKRETAYASIANAGHCMETEIDVQQQLRAIESYSKYLYIMGL